MYYKVCFDNLYALNCDIRNQSGAWNEELNAVQSAVARICASANISGAGADSIKQYFENVHGSIITAMSYIIQSHCNNNWIYWSDYQSNIDSDAHAMIESFDLHTIAGNLQDCRIRTEAVEDNVVNALNRVKDLVPLTLQGTDYVYETQNAVKNFVDTLDREICELEDRHCEEDFKDIEAAIASLKQFISEQAAHSRNYKESFTTVQLSGSESLKQLYEQCVRIEEAQQEKADLLLKAIENDNERVAVLQKEYEDQQKRAEQMKYVKWAVTGLCIIGSVVAIAATGGAATPLVVGAVSAASGAVSAGVSTVADQYTANGNLKDTNWASVGKSAALGGATGFVTGAIGAGVSGAVTAGLSQTAVGATLLNSSNAFIRVGTGAVIGSASEVSSGIVSRGAATYFTTGNIDTAVDEAFNLENIVFDATVGGVGGGINAAKNPMGKEIKIDDLDNADLIESKPLNSPDPEKWINSGGKINVDGNGTWTYTSSDGVNACYTDGYPDFDRAGLVKDTYTVEDGFDTKNHTVDINKAKSATREGTSGSGMTWHHNQDGSTLELVPTKYHKLFTHRGGFSIAKGGKIPK